MSESRYPFCELAGVGVAFKTVCAIETMLCNRDDRDIPEAIKSLCMEYTELVCIGTVADVMPLVDENRLLCAMGLHMIREAPSLGTDALMYAASLGETVSAADSDRYVNRPREVSKRKINASYIGFVIAPRINAAGRVTHAFDAVELLLTENKKDAMRAAFHLCDVNTTRKSLENVISETVISEIGQYGEPEHKIIVLSSDE
jgi:single-stranded-DNA-specific exonuclease